jgi:hypothetical protein
LVPWHTKPLLRFGSASCCVPGHLAPALFGGFFATMAESDFSCPSITGFGSSEAAEVVILVDRLDRAAEAVKIARRTRAIARQSIVAGMALSGAAMGAAALGQLTPVAAAITQEGIDVLVILNALRALFSGKRSAPRGLAISSEALWEDHHTLEKGLNRLREIADALDDADRERAELTHRWEALLQREGDRVLNIQGQEFVLQGDKAEAVPLEKAQLIKAVQGLVRAAHLLDDFSAALLPIAGDAFAQLAEITRPLAQELARMFKAEFIGRCQRTTAGWRMGSRHSTEASRASPIIYQPVASAIAVVQGVDQGAGEVVMTELRDF